MGRWAPDARGRLLRAAMELFAEQGYDATTTTQIAERAGLTKTTLFRQFPDKREILLQGQEALVELVTAAVENGPEESSALDLMRTGVRALASDFTDEQRDRGRALDPIIAASPELRERAVFKRSAITGALEHALSGRTGNERAAGILADLGVRAFYTGYESWVAADDERPLADHVEHELAAHQEAAIRSLEPAGG